ncbi:MAG: cytochrome P450 [bacterium]|nr:cytochrome [Deltaproteobacteria bacterium]MCP4906225.1 cytochrome P450 [bacterium]
MIRSDINPFDSESGNRYLAFREMRGVAPAHEVDGGQLFIVRQKAVEEGLKSVGSFVGSFGDIGQAAEEDTIMAAIPEPRHGKIRKLFNSALAYNHASQVEPFVRRYAAGRIDDTLACATRDGEVEIMETYARRIPSAVIAEVLGIPNDRIDDFARWSDEVLVLQGEEDRVNEPIWSLHPEFTRYIEEQIQMRVDSEDPPNDMITRLLQVEVEGERLSQRAVLTQSMFLIIAGNETTRNLIGNVIRRLAEDPSRYQQVREDRSLVPTLVEETLRVDSPVQLLARTCTQDVEIDGVQIKKGDRVLHSLASANRDESVYSDPEEFRLDRPKPRDHVAFGAGPHICPGAFLARMETEVAVETLLDRVAEMALAPGYVWDPNPVFWALGPRTLRVILTPA